jgi:hypothetical protein
MTKRSSRTELTPWTRQTVEDLLARTRHTLTLDDWPLVAALNDADRELADPTTADNAALLRRPVWIRGTACWPMTIGLAEWLNDVVVPWFRHDEHKLGLAMAWTLTIERPHEVLSTFEGPEEMWRTVRTWARACRWTDTDFEHVLQRWFPQSTPDAKNEGPGPLVGLLAREYRMEPDYILNQAGEGLIETLVNDWTRRQDIEARAASRARGKAPRVTASASHMALARRLKARRAILDAWTSSVEPTSESASHVGPTFLSDFPSPVPGLDG